MIDMLKCFKHRSKVRSVFTHQEHPAKHQEQRPGRANLIGKFEQTAFGHFFCLVQCGVFQGVGGPKGARRGGARNFALFSSSATMFILSSLLLGVLSWNFEKWGAQMHVWVSGCCVKPTPSGPNPSGPPSKYGFDVDISGSRGTKK